MLSYPIAFAPGTEALAATAEGKYQEGQLSVTTQDGRRLRMGLPDGSSFLIGWPKAEDARAVDPGAGGYAATQNLVITSGHALHTCVVTVAAHSGAYTCKLVLRDIEASGVDVLDGTFYELLLDWPASSNPTLEVYNETTSEPKLWGFNDSVANQILVRFHRTGGAWRAWGASFIS